MPHDKGELPHDLELQVASPESSSDDNDATLRTTKARIPFFRSTLFQILVVGSCAFCAPGVSK
jgi:hypothetical protein